MSTSTSQQPDRPSHHSYFPSSSSSLNIRKSHSSDDEVTSRSFLNSNNTMDKDYVLSQGEDEDIAASVRSCKELGKRIRKKEFKTADELLETLPPSVMRNENCVEEVRSTNSDLGWNLYDEHLCRHRFLFVSGMHHSGTSVTNYILQTLELISGHRGTGSGQDEGVGLQKEYPPAIKFGGACNFVHHHEIYLNATHEAATPEARRCIMAQWSKYWNLSRPVLLEKSPPTLIQIDYRAYLFPHVSANIIVVRHPLYMCFVKKNLVDLEKAWVSDNGIRMLTRAIEGWLKAHEFVRSAILHPNRKTALIQYESYFKLPDAVDHLLELPTILFPEIIEPYNRKQLKSGMLPRQLEYRSGKDGGNRDKPKIDPKYLTTWMQTWTNNTKTHEKLYKSRILPVLRKYESRVNQFGYSLIDVNDIGGQAFASSFKLDKNSIVDNGYR